MQPFVALSQGLSRQVSALPLAFVRVCFGILMVVYSAGKCSDELGNKEMDKMYLGFDSRVPRWIVSLTERFPFYTDNYLYWHLHAPLMLLSACGIAFTFGLVSRISCLSFAVLKHVLTLQDQTNYNNHEYLYALLALVFSLLGGHDASLSFMGSVAICERDGGCSGIMGAGSTASASAAAASASCLWVALLMAFVGTLYMLLQNATYGIAGRIAVIGMCLFVWPGVVLMLGASKDGDSCSSAAASASTTGVKESGSSGKQCEERQLSPTVPYWNVLFMRMFFGIVYLFAGVAKTDRDWLSGSTAVELFRMWTGPSMLQAARRAIISPIISTSAYASTSTFTSTAGSDNGSWEEQLGRVLVSIVLYGGTALDLGSVLLLNCPSLAMRLGAASAVGTFHVINHASFIIETFPWVMISGLAVHFDDVWIEHCGRWLRRLLLGTFHLPRVFRLLQRAASLLAPVLLAAILAMHFLIPLPCAIHTVGDDGSLVWGSQCSYFCWRMMTRSVRTTSTQLRFQDPITGNVDVVPMLTSALYPHMHQARQAAQGTPLERHAVELELGWDKFLHESAAYEDRIAYIVKEALSRVSPRDGLGGIVGNTPRVFADVWLEINGPPCQRYIDPAVDLAEESSRVENRWDLWPPHSAPSPSSLLSRPTPLAAWVLPRLTQFRTDEWLRRFRRLEALVVARMRRAVGRTRRPRPTAASPLTGDTREGTGDGADNVCDGETGNCPHSNPNSHPYSNIGEEEGGGGEGGGEGGSRYTPPVLFLADHPHKGLLRLRSFDAASPQDRDNGRDREQAVRGHLELVLLSGEAEIVNVGRGEGRGHSEEGEEGDGGRGGGAGKVEDTQRFMRLSAGACLRVQGPLVLRTLGEQPSLWMAVSTSVDRRGFGRMFGADERTTSHHHRHRHRAGEGGGGGGGGGRGAAGEEEDAWEGDLEEPPELLYVGHARHTPRPHEVFAFCVSADD